MFFKQHRYHRKYKFIDKKQQVRFAVDVALHSLLFPILLLILMITPLFSRTLLGRDALAVEPIIRAFYATLLNHWWVLLPPLLFIGILSVLFSHRVFGPIRRFENALHLKQEKPHELVRCNLRGADYFQEFSKLLESVLNQGVVPPPAKTGTDNPK